MTEIPIVVSDDVVTVGGYTNQVELQLSVGATGERGSRIFTGSVDPTTLPTDSPIWGGYTDFKSGDIYLLRDTGVLEVWEWLYASGEYTWVRTVEDIAGSGGSVTLDPDLNAIANLSGTGILRRTGVNAWALDTAAYLTSNQTVTLSGDVSGSGTTSIITTVADDSHSHTGATISALDAGDTTTGTFNIARIPTGTTGTTVALGSHTHNYVGLVSSTDNAVARFDGTGGALQNSGVTVDDSSNVTTPGTLYIQRNGLGIDLQATDATNSWCGLRLSRGYTRRWDIQKSDYPAETGSGNTGSDLQIARYADNGDFLGRITYWRNTGKLTLDGVGSTAGLEFGASGPRMMMGTGGPSGISAPVGSTWRQTDANSSHGSLTGLLWTRVTGPGTNTEGTDWLVDYEGRWVSYTPTISGWSKGDGTASGVCTRRGRTMQFRAKLVVGSSTTFAAACNFSLPQSTSAATTQYAIAQAELVDISTSTYTASANMTSSVVQVYATGGTYAAYTAMSSTVPFSWTTNDLVVINGTYEIA